MPRRGGGAGGLWGLSGGGELRAGVNENTIPNTVIRPDTPSPKLQNMCEPVPMTLKE